LDEWTFINIDYRSPHYWAAFALRDQVLRKPLGLSMEDADPAVEQVMRHFGMIANDTLMACVLALPAEGNTAIIRQMAVAKNYRGRGIGSRILNYAEQQLWREGIIALRLSARISAMAFYEAAGYTAYGDEYLSVTVPHRWMRKTLTANDTSD